MMRLDKFLGNMGEGSRKEIKRLAGAGAIAVNGAKALNPAMAINEEKDRVEVAGVHIPYEPFIYLMMNKPPGVLTATRDSRQPTVMDLVDHKRSSELFPVGRLDKDTEGLLVLTNDGPLAHALLSPKKHVPKIYHARVSGALGPADVKAFAEGLVLEDGTLCLPAMLAIIDGGMSEEGPWSEAAVTIHEGKFHQVKRMFQVVGTQVVYLKRLAMGGLQLDPELLPGQWRRLDREDLKKLRDETC